MKIMQTNVFHILKNDFKLHVNILDKQTKHALKTWHYFESTWL